jgi:hypothetical protein
MANGGESYPPAPSGGRIRLLNPEASAGLTAEEKAKCIAGLRIGAG